MHIEVHVHRPLALLAVFGTTIATVLLLTSVTKISAEAPVANLIPPADTEHIHIGGTEEVPQEEEKEAEQDIRQAWQRRAVLEHKEEILRYQLRVLEEVAKSAEDDSELRKEIAEHRNTFVQLLRDKREAERYLLSSFRQLWEAQLTAGSVSGSMPARAVRLRWPVAPKFGISAYFRDSTYEDRFGIPHQAVDIPVEQGSQVMAAASGVVEKIAENGYGYNYIIIRHEGMATVYGHVQSFLVEEGQQVHSGQPIALSGGLPGTKGAGALSTGPHVHFEVVLGGKRVDPLDYLVAAYPEV